ncbi:hypothetical protein VTP01DRAFT_8123 [Rhizomucor pusillus]|uniref:uncharacterized protein n=1 Tax=Rhizomucor pusillus TaxID=4840 RepID=UPI003742B587
MNCGPAMRRLVNYRGDIGLAEAVFEGAEPPSFENVLYSFLNRKWIGILIASEIVLAIFIRSVLCLPASVLLRPLTPLSTPSDAPSNHILKSIIKKSRIAQRRLHPGCKLPFGKPQLIRKTERHQLSKCIGLAAAILVSLSSMNQLGGGIAILTNPILYAVGLWKA